MRLDEIIAALPALSGDERERLMRAMRALPGGEPAGLKNTPDSYPRSLGPPKTPQRAGTGRETALKSGSDGDIDLCLSAIANMLQRRGLEYARPYVLRKHPGFSAFVQKVPPVMELLRKATINRVELSYLVELSAGLLYEDLTRMGLTAVSSRLLMNHFHRVPSVINKAFPGYLAAGLLGHVIKRTSARK